MMGEGGMKILWHSNAPWSPTGYGNQTMVFTPRLAREHTVTISAYYGLEGHVLRWKDGIDVVPRQADPYGSDILPGHMQARQAELLITLLDVWVLDPAVMAELPWAAWCPVDHDPLPPPVKEMLDRCRWPIAMSQFGRQMMQEAGYSDVAYIPHGIETSVFKPGDRKEARRGMNEIAQAQHGRDDAGRSDLVNDNTFLVAMVAANKGNPSRKGIHEALRAWARFHAEVPNSHLYLHMEKSGTMGVYLPGVIQLLGIPETSISFPPQYGYNVGVIGPGYLNQVYNAADVLLNPSYGEGFGIPIVEAQAAGCPVIVGDNSSMKELCFAGWKVSGERFITPQMAYQYLPDVDELTDLLHQAHARLGPGSMVADDMREQAWLGAQQYDADKVYEEYWRPFLARVQSELEAGSLDQKRWGTVGIGNPDGTFSVPNLDSEEEMLLKPDGTTSIIPGGFKTVVNGIDLSAIEDVPGSGVYKTVMRELERDTYGIEGLTFAPGSKAVDIGANVGVVSIYLALRHPQLARIDSYEPHPANYEQLVKNIQTFGLAHRIFPHQAAVTGDGRAVRLAVSPENSGGHHVVDEGGDFPVSSVAFKDLVAEPVAFLKIDCEGAEYEFIPDFTYEGLANVKAIGAEFHWLEDKTETPEDLVQMIQAAGVPLAFIFAGWPQQVKAAEVF